MKVIIAGSREGFTQSDVNMFMEHIAAPAFGEITEIVSGTANGVDKFGEYWANLVEIPITRFPADWSKYGKSAGYRRNESMAVYADALVAFRYNESKGTTHMIKLAKEHGLHIFVVDKSPPFKGNEEIFWD